MAGSAEGRAGQGLGTVEVLLMAVAAVAVAVVTPAVHGALVCARLLSLSHLSSRVILTPTVKWVLVGLTSPFSGYEN